MTKLEYPQVGADGLAMTLDPPSSRKAVLRRAGPCGDETFRTHPADTGALAGKAVWAVGPGGGDQTAEHGGGAGAVVAAGDGQFVQSRFSVA